MTMQETSRFIEGLRRRGWTDTQINNFFLFLESGVEVGPTEKLQGDPLEATKQ